MDISLVLGLKNLIGFGIDYNDISDLSLIVGLVKLSYLIVDNN